MRSLVISAITKRSFPALILGKSMPHSCHGGCLDITFYRPLHTSGFREAYLNAIFSGGNNLYEESRVCKTWVFRTLSTKAVETEKTAEEEEEASSQGLQVSLYKRISRIGARKSSAVAELEGWINEGKKQPKKLELKRMVKELRNYSRYEHALEIDGELAIHLDLIAKVRGIVSAEKYFADLSDTEKNQDTYSALLNCYIKERNIEKSEATMGKLKYLGLAKYTLTYNQMMTLYMNTQQFEKVPLVIQEMKKNGWTIYSTLANIYLKAKVLEKVESALKELENKMKRKDRAAYDHLISLHGSLRNKDEVYRIWKSFELAFPKMTNKSYICFLSSLVRIGDIEGAENFLKKWESRKLFDDIGVYNVLLGAYIRKGWLKKAEVLIEHVLDNGFQPNAHTRHILAVASDPTHKEGYRGNVKVSVSWRNCSMAAKVMKFAKHTRAYDRR